MKKPPNATITNTTRPRPATRKHAATTPNESRRPQEGIFVDDADRQVTVALRVYLDENGHAYPCELYTPAPNPQNVFFWYEALGTYLPNHPWGTGAQQARWNHDNQA